MVLYYIKEKTFFVINDTLEQIIDTKKPVKFSSKVYTIPHLDSFIFGIGVSEFTKQYFDQILNIVTDDVEYLKKASKRICLNNYYKMGLHKSNVYTKVFLIKRVGFDIAFISFCSENKFEPKLTTDAVGFYPQNNRIASLFENELSQEKIEVNNIYKIIEENEAELDAGGQYFIHMFSGDAGFLISKIGESRNYKKVLKEMIENCSRIDQIYGKTIYFDQNIWGNLLEEVHNANYSLVKKIKSKISDLKISIAYSFVNIKETSRRGIESNLFEEISLIKQLTNNLYISPDFKLQYHDPYEVIAQISMNDPIIDSLLNSFKENLEELIESNSTDVLSSQILESKILNNIPTSQIFDFLDSHFEKMTNEYDQNDSLNPSIKVFYEKTINLIVDILETTFCSIDGFDGSSIISQVRKIMMDKGEEFLNIEITTSSVKPTQIDSLFNNFGYNKELLPGLLNGFLEASNYHPDSKKLKNKKGVKIDEDDMSHANYCSFFDYFVTEDSKLRKRLLAVKEKMNIETEIIDMKCFADLLDNLE